MTSSLRPAFEDPRNVGELIGLTREIMAIVDQVKHRLPEETNKRCLNGIQDL